ncbi:TetR/AcrR family transcriptional regulator [Deinococcus sp. UYEF24]
MDTTLHPQTRRHLINSERLRNAAIEEFASQGFLGAKVSNIVAVAELTQPSFYRVWPSKEAAYHAIIDETNTIWQEAAFNSLLLEGDQPEAPLLQRKICHFFQVLTSNLNLTRMVLHHNLQSDRHSLYVEIYRASFETLQQTGRIRTALAPELLAQVYSALTERVLYARLLNQDRTPKQAAEELVSVLLPLLYTR